MSQAMVVDDSKAMRMILSRNLAEMGYDVCAAADGAEALGLLREEMSLILVDWNMPRMNGLELVEAPRRSALRIPEGDDGNHRNGGGPDAEGARGGSQ